jgi:vacuolar-type H+-ATPase subunit I/STV1
MTASENLSKLTKRAKQAEQKAADAMVQARSDLEKAADESRASVEAEAAKLQATVAASKSKVSSVWDQQQQAWNDHVAKLRQQIDQRTRDMDLVLAEDRAEGAEADAMFAIDFAYSAIEQAESAALDAILARADASDAAAASGRGSA